jgi:hypothetical protein
MDSKLSRIGVVARLRPILAHEIKKGLVNTLVEVDTNTKSIT